MIHDSTLQQRYVRIKRHLTQPITVYENYGMLSFPQHQLYIAKRSQKFRLRSHLDWAWYTPQTLADAINNNTVGEYYEIMLNHVNSDPNEWPDLQFENLLKGYYAARVGRASLI